MDPNLRDVVDRSSALAAKGDGDGARKLLNLAIEAAVSKDDPRSIVLLARHAATISDHDGDLKGAERYLHLALTHKPDDINALYMIGDVCSRMGQSARAREFFIECLRISRDQRNQGMLELLAVRGYQVAADQDSNNQEST